MEFKPHPYQAYCIDRVIKQPKIGLFLDMGLGKTIITLQAIYELKYNRFAVQKVLIIAPKKVAEATWQREAQKWDGVGILRISTVLGSLSKRVKALNTPADIYIINRDNVTWLVDYYKNDWPFDMVVADESSSFKNHAAKRFKSLAHMYNHIKRMVLLTGTPTPKGLIDLWAQIYLLDRGQTLGRTYTSFRDHFFIPDQRSQTVIYSYKPKDTAENDVLRAISHLCMSMKSEDYLTLPPVIEDIVPVQLPPKAQRDYDEMETRMVLELVESGEEITAVSAAALSTKLQQLANGAVYDELRNVHEIHDCKIEAFKELIEQLSGKPALVFYNFKHDLERLKAALDKSGLVVKELRGAEEEREWNAGQIDVLLAHPASTAYGLNLQDGGNHVIWFGLNWSLELYQQANKRLHRQGQKEKVIIHHLISIGTRDEDMMEALNRKADAQEYVLQSLKARIDKVKGEQKHG
jgi:SNF2 domain protein|uniref:Chromatin remodeling complex ATPase n=2 Tax=unclassified Caudoviricetes TaxID=2788787 RepID=A0A8S5N9R5_9CAUD|nr:MAG TPA: Chromatin remodeling complex ATPase [Siphoviridae sp. ctkBO7]DAD91135.1 MAG TPA: Chromatin remodeling complex ATPase [Siphoviridae sp. ctuaf34]